MSTAGMIRGVGVLSLLLSSAYASDVAVSRVTASGTTRYVKAGNIGAAEPYTSVETAAATIQDAVDACGDDDIIMVDDGVYDTGGRVTPGYALMNRVCITNAITLCSVNGSGATIIVGSADPASTNGDAAVRCVYMANSGAILSGFTLTNGHTRASGDTTYEKCGGGIHGYNGGVVEDCHVIDCSAPTYGGGAYYGILKRCQLTGNAASRGGGAYQSVLSDCALFGNYASSYGGGAYESDLTGCTVVGNSAAPFGYGGGAYKGALKNCIVYYNEAKYSSSADVSGGTYSNCCMGNAYPNGNNFSAPPQVVSTHNPRLLVGSPCINAGDNAFVNSALDFEREPRTNGIRVDVGCDESWPEALSGPIGVSVETPDGTDVVVGHPVAFLCDVTGAPSSYTWDFDDGIRTSNVFQVTHTFASPGVYDVTLQATNTDHSTTVTVAVDVASVATATWYVKTNGNDSASGLSWGEAKATIQAAVDAAGATYRGAHVVVTNGTYDAGGMLAGGMTNRVVITNRVTVSSVNGPTNTIIVGQGPMGDSAVRCVYMAENTALTGFTLTNGYTVVGGGGGGIWAADESAVISNCWILGNSASGGGGAYHGTLYDCLLNDNLATDGGGGASESALIGCTLSNNTATTDGGGTYSCRLEGCTLISNSATNNGGGAHNSWLNNCTVEGNAAHNGGGISWTDYYYSWAPVSNCVLKANSASYNGGGANGTILDNCMVIGNLAGSYGGGAYVWYGVHRNCTFVGNAAAYGPGAYNGVLYNCILYYNETWDGWGGDYAYDYSDDPDYPVAPYGLTNCCRPGFTIEASGCIADEPAIVSKTNPRLWPGSPCIGAGGNAYVAGTTDIDGESRIVGVNVDIGCDEFWADGLTGDLSASLIAPLGTQVVAGTELLFECDVVGKPLGSLLDFDDGSSTANVFEVTHTFAAIGTYDVTFTATNLDHAAAVTVTVHVVDEPTATWYVSPDGSDTWSGRSWAQAKRTLQAAVDAAGGTYRGAHVLVADGTYESGGSFAGGMTNRVTITNAVHVRSENGRTNAIIVGRGPVGDSAIRCVYLGDLCTLSGFTVTNGHTLLSASDGGMDGGGIYVGGNGVVVSNCVISGNRARSSGGGIYGQGTLYDCVLSGNAASSGAGAYNSTLWDCGLSDNTAGNNGGGAYAGTMNNCTVSSNTATNRGGASYGGTLRNCLVWNNVAAGSSYGSYGGGTYVGSLYNCTVIGNSASSRGGGTYGSYIYNSIIWGNTAGDQYPNVFASSSAYYDSCCAETGIPNGSNGSITDTPLFVGAEAGDFRLHPGSPCIDVGNNANAPTNVSPYDLAGDARIINGTVNMGAYEAVPDGEFDFGDLPAAYGLTTIADNGALHTMGTVFLGSAIDGENDGAESSAADGDDTTGSPDDEDGVAVAGSWRSETNGAAVSVVVSGGDGYLSGWIDWDGNDQFSDVGDHVLDMKPVETGEQTLHFTVPEGTITTNGTYNVFARFRLSVSDAPALATTGYVASGEVEDYKLSFTGYVPDLQLVTPPTARLDYAATIDGADPAAQTFSITNVGNSSVAYSNQVVYGAYADGWFAPAPAAVAVATGDAVQHTGVVNIAGLGVGVYSATNYIISASNGLIQGAIAITLSVHDPAEGYSAFYVDASRPDDSGDGTTWVTAKKTVQAAVDLASDGDTVWVNDGTYNSGGAVTPGHECHNRLVITRDITVRSVNGPELTIIEGAEATGGGNGDDAIRGVYMTAGLLSGFTVTNGHTMLWRLGLTEHRYDLFGGGINFYGGDGVASNCIIAGNSAGYYEGGGCYTGTLYNCTFSGNSARYGGGSSDSILVDCTLTQNSAQYGGGGSYGGTLDRCTLSGNSANYGGGSYGGVLSNCALFGNSVDGSVNGHGGGSVAGTLINCTVTGNSAKRGGGTYAATLTNCIVYHNEASIEGDNWWDGSSAPNISYSCTTPHPGGVGNITDEPALVSVSHIHPNSPCVGEGASAYSLGFDIDGDSWSTPPSMGCDEPHTGAFGDLRVALDFSSLQVAMGYSLSLAGSVVGNAASNCWSFGDAEFENNTLNVRHAWSAPGDYEVVLTAFNSSHPDGVSATAEVHVVDATYYVDQACATPSAPFASWASAAATIQEAVDTAAATGIEGATVLVADGIYDSGTRITPGYACLNRLVITDNIVVRSLNGSGAAVIAGAEATGGGNGTDAVRGVYMSAGELRGFTITNGHTMDSGDSTHDQSGGGVTMCDGRAIVVDCALTGNAADANGGAGYYGVFRNCRIDGNAAPFGGGCYRSDLYNCALTANSASSHGGGAAFCRLYNCTVTGNAAERLGGGVYWSTLRNCIAYHNKAGLDGDDWAYGGSLISYSCTRSLPEGVGNITNAPLLVGASHIYANSPCVGAGLPDFASGADIDGDAWGIPPSMGCDEPLSTAGPLAVSIACDDNPTVVRDHNLTFSAVISGTPSSNLWTFDDGTSRPNAVYDVQHAWSSAGDYNVVLTAWNPDSPAGVSDTVSVHVVDSYDCYVDQNSTSPVPPYVTWATAATNIQDAVDQASSVAGSTVWVTNGYYNTGSRVLPGQACANRLVIGSDIHVRSVNGPDETTIRGWSRTRGVYMTAGRLSDFTIIYGYTMHTNDAYSSIADLIGGGLYMLGPDVVASNCVITGNAASLYGGGVAGGTLIDCTLTNNATGPHDDSNWPGGGGSYYSDLIRCVVVSNTSYCDGGGCYGGTLSFCTLAGNTAYGEGGGCYETTVNHCTLTGNSANRGGAASDSLLSYCTLVGNSASEGGGLCEGAANYCHIRTNSASRGGGAYGSALDGCTLQGNTASSYGGGTHDGTLKSCLVRGNTATVYYGGGCYQSDVRSSTIVGNSAGLSGGGAYECDLLNSIIWNNTAPDADNIFMDGATVAYCCSPDLLLSSGNTTNDPHFVGVASNDYRLTEGSPCIDTGVNESWMVGATDLEGKWRIRGGTVNMGAYETAYIGNDYGDAPSPYPTLVASGGPYHVAEGPRLGSIRDEESDGQPTSGANGDDTHGTPDDEDGISAWTNLFAGALDASVLVDVQNAPSGAKLDAWIDFNADGAWGGPSEQIADSRAVSEGINMIAFDVPAWAVATNTYARFRLSESGGLAPGGNAPSGEVEDYRLAIASPLAGLGRFSSPQNVSTNVRGVNTLFAADVDGDGDMDVLSASMSDNKIAWHENDGAQSFTERIISTNAPSARGVFAADVDADGDMDVLSASYGDDKIAWYENDGHQRFAEHVISTNADEVRNMFVADVDSDGDLDVLSASTGDDKVAWYENDGSEGFTERLVGTADGAYSVFAADVDSDGDMDVLSASYADRQVDWYENNGNQSFTKHTIATYVSGAASVFAADVDGDGDMDVLSASYSDDTVAWYENDGSQGFTKRTITSTATMAYNVFAADLDGDGDTDVMSGGVGVDGVSWYENDGGGGFTPHSISTVPSDSFCVQATDMDGDGDLDVLAALTSDGSIAWYEQSELLELTVNSPHGAPSPADGLHRMTNETVVTCSVSEVEKAGATRYLSLGWRGTGSVSAVGTGTTVTVTMTNDSSIAWQWATQHWFSANVDGMGYVDQPDQWVNAGTVLSVEATPSNGYHFVSWTNSVESVENPLELTMDVPKDVLATFAINQYTVTCTSTGMGTVTPGDVLVDHGADALFTAHPTNSEFAAREWLLDGVPVQASGSTFALENVETSHVVSVSFGIATVPIAPTGLVATLERDGVHLAWHDNALSETSWTVFRLMEDSVAWNWTRSLAGSDHTGYIDTEVAAGVAYSYKVVAVNALGQSIATPVATVDLPGPPQAPTHLLASADGATVDLQWQDNADDETGFILIRKKKGEWIPETTVLYADTTTYSDSGLVPNATYDYELQAFNSVGRSWSARVSVTTPAEEGTWGYSLSVSNVDLLFNGVAVSGEVANGAVVSGTFDAQQSNPSDDGYSLHRVALGFRDTNGVPIAGMVELWDLYEVPGSPGAVHKIKIPDGFKTPGSNGVYNLWAETCLTRDDPRAWFSAMRTTETNALACLLTNVTIEAPTASTVRALDADTIAGTSFLVPVMIEAQGGEHEISVCLTRDSDDVRLTLAKAGRDCGPGAWAYISSVRGNPATREHGFTVTIYGTGELEPGSHEIALLEMYAMPDAATNHVTTLDLSKNRYEQYCRDADGHDMPVTWMNGEVRVIGTHVEGDVSPRIVGDGKVDGADWRQMGRYIAGLEHFSTSGERNRADCAPYATRGDGVVDVADWVQVGRFVAGLDPIVPESTPIATSALKKQDLGTYGIDSSGATIGIVDGTIDREEAGDVFVWLDGAGSERALAFSVRFNDSELAFLSASPVGTATNATFLPNVTDSNTVGFALQMPDGSTFDAGSNAVLKMRFAAAPGAVSSTVDVAFVDSPVVRGVSDVAGTTVAASWLDGVVSVVASVVAPTLTPPTNVVASAVAMGQINLTWSDLTGEDGYGILRQGPAGTWRTAALLASNTMSYVDSGLDEGTTYRYRIAASNSAGMVYSAIATGRTWNAIEHWRAENFGTIASVGDTADTADWDGDGEKNLMEYAVGRSPVSFDSNAVFEVSIEELVESNRFAVIRYRTPSPSPDGVEVAPEMTTNLIDGAWERVLVPVDRVESNGMETIRLRAPEPTGSQDRGFLRLKAWR